jgi:hypothetical protein
MRKFLIVAALFMCMASVLQAAPAVTVQASAVTLLGSSQSISITVQLIDPNNAGLLNVSGTGIVPNMRASTVTPGTTATVGPMYGNDVIQDAYGNSNATYYMVSVYPINSAFISSTPAFQQFFAFTGSGTVDLAVATPLAPSFMSGPLAETIPGLLNGGITSAGPDVLKPSNLSNIRVVDGVKFTTIAGALADLPTDPISDTGNSYKHGVIYLPFLASGYNVSSTLTLNPFIKIIGEGMPSTAINCIGSITCINFYDNPFTIRDSDGGLYNVAIKGDGSANQIGLQGTDAFGLVLENVKFYGFTGTGAVATNLSNVSFFTERTHFDHVQWFKNTVNIQLNAPSASNVSFGHQHWTDLRFHVGGLTNPSSGPTGPVIQLTGYADLYDSLITGVVNNDNSAAGSDKVFNLTGTNPAAVAQTTFLNLMVDNFGGGTMIGAACATAGQSFDPSGNFLGYTSNSCGPNVVAGTTYYASIPSMGGSLGAGGTIIGIVDYPPPNNQIGVSNGYGPAGIGATMIPNIGANGGFYEGFGLNGWLDGSSTSFCTQGDGTHNGGAFILNQTRTTWAPPRLYVIPDSGGAKQCVSAAAMDSTYLKGNLGATVGSGTTTTNGTVIGAGTSQVQPGISVTGAAATDTATCSLNGSPPATWQTGIQMLPPVVTANTVTVWLSNPTAAGITPATTVVRCTVTR